ncbi:3-dehydroquinate synthase [Novispirillum sp. DQ9]|uniref:3-dehydroquinate synthase n=1 Tax=Novispirillum sp. DQ9 TaxID=3398612 RepID=UPI003C7B9507
MTTAAPSVLKVDLGDRAYDIVTGPGLLEVAGEHVARVVRGRKAFIVTDDNVAPHYLDTVQASLTAAAFAVSAHVLPAGEQAKSWTHLEALLDAMLAARMERSSVVVALGGGVIGDLAGFAASILLRGVDFVQLPTTLLAQVDSSVGGKTGINTTFGKNLVGSFHQPRLVLADTATLDTLPDRELRAGYAEVAKYGLIDDLPFWEWLEVNAPRVLAREPEALARAIHTSCAAKARVVAADERESGQRALLNLGHTFGHALEAEGGYGGPLLHGEAVAVGMVMAFALSADLGLCPAEDAARVRAHLAACGLPVDPPCPNGRPMDARRLLAHMGSDKKVEGGRVTFVLARGIGQSYLDRDIAPDRVLAILEQATSA